MLAAFLRRYVFLNFVVEECYKAGAGKVTVEWEYNPVTKATYKYCKLDVLSRTEKWEEEKYKHFVETRPARIFIESDDPDALKGVNQEKVAKAQQARAMAFKPYRDQLDNHYQWCIAAVPGVEWAKKVFPGEHDDVSGAAALAQDAHHLDAVHVRHPHDDAGRTIRTEYRYDAEGNLLSETRSRG